MISRFARLALAVLATASFAVALVHSAPSVAPAPFADGEYVDNRLGIKIFVPKAWTQIPLSLDERWMVAKFLSDKSYFWTEKGGGWTNEHRPDLQIIAFVADAMKDKLKVDKKDLGDGSTELRVFLENPYKSYEDFLKARYAGGGWFVSDKKEGKVGDVAVTQYEIKVEKLSIDGPKRIFTWIYHVPDVDIAVQYEVLENSIDKLKTEIARTQKSFKQIPRKGGPLYEVSTGDDYSWMDQDKLTKEERKSRRQGMEQRSHDKATKSAPAGWKVSMMGRFLVMNHADDKFAKLVVDQCEAVWTWLDKNFPFVGEGEYVRGPIIRICANQEEYNSFFKSGNWFGLNDLEITAYQDFSGKTGWQMQNVNRRVKDIWFKDKDLDLYTAMPTWLSTGLDNFVGNIHVAKNGTIEFSTDHDVREQVRERLRLGTLNPPKTLITTVDRDFTDFWGKMNESAFLVNYLVNGKNKKTKDLLCEYMRNLRAVALEVKKETAEKKGEVKAGPKTEEEEDAWFKNQQQGFRDAERRFVDETCKRTFVGWSDDDWKKFQEAYEKSL